MSDTPKDQLPVALDKIGKVAIVSFNRPKHRNAMNTNFVAQLSRLLDRCALDDEIGAIIFHGKGTGFCAGSDLRELAPSDQSERFRFEADCGRVARQIGECAKTGL